MQRAPHGTQEPETHPGETKTHKDKYGRVSINRSGDKGWQFGQRRSRAGGTYSHTTHTMIETKEFY